MAFKITSADLCILFDDEGIKSNLSSYKKVGSLNGLVKILKTNVDRGLSEDDLGSRKEHFGSNEVIIPQPIHLSHSLTHSYLCLTILCHG